MTFKILWHGFNLQAAGKRLFEVISDWIGVTRRSLSVRFSKDLRYGVLDRGAPAGNVPFRLSL